MIGHQAKPTLLPVGLAARLAQRAEKAPPVLLIPENRLAPVAGIHHMIERPGILDAELARRAA